MTETVTIICRKAFTTKNTSKRRSEKEKSGDSVRSICGIKKRGRLCDSETASVGFYTINLTIPMLTSRNDKLHPWLNLLISVHIVDF